MTLPRLSPEDRALLRSDRDPRSRPTIGQFAVLAGSPDWELLRERIDRASRVRRALRERAVEPTLATTEPRWVVDPDFDLDRHVRRIALPAPGTREQLTTLVEQLLATPFDPAAPLWTLTCVDGVEGGAAVIAVASPLVRDQGGPVDLLALAFDGGSDGTPMPAQPVPTDLEPTDLARAGVRELPWRAVGLALGGVNQAAGLAVQAATHPRGVIDQALLLMSPPAPPRGSALIAGRGTTRRLVLRSVPVARVLSAPAHRGVERVHLAAVRAALLRYHEELGLPQGALQITEASHPAAMRRALAPESDPIDTYGRLLPLMPAGIVDAVVRPSRGVDIAVAAIRVERPGALGSATVTQRYAVGPVPGNAVTSVALTDGEAMTIALRYDTEAIKDPGLLERCLDQALEDTLGPATAAPTPATSAKRAPARAAAKRASATQSPDKRAATKASARPARTRKAGA
jgi:hypothetical protein